jgi:hypothetical protein
MNLLEQINYGVCLVCLCKDDRQGHQVKVRACPACGLNAHIECSNYRWTGDVGSKSPIRRIVGKCPVTNESSAPCVDCTQDEPFLRWEDGSTRCKACGNKGLPHLTTYPVPCGYCHVDSACGLMQTTGEPWICLECIQPEG